MSKINFAFAILFSLLLSEKIISQPSINSEWTAETFFVSNASVNIYKEPTTEAEVIGNFSYLERVLVIIDTRMTNKFGWKKVVHPQVGFVEEKFLISQLKKTELIKSQYYDDVQRWQTTFKYCTKDYSYIKEQSSFESKTSGLIQKEEKVLCITDETYKNKIWLKCLYPIAGYIIAEDFVEDNSNFVVRIGGAYGVENLPYEKNLTKFTSPIGGFVEVTKSNWRINFRIGYNHSGTNLNTYHLKTDLFYFLTRYEFLRLFNNHLNPYALIGGAYWMSNFQNTKYPSLTSYFPLEKDSGPAYMLGGGLIYNLYGFFIDIQYFFFGSRQAVFGKEPLPGEFSNQYKLYPGSNQFNVMIGYSFTF
ncbi:MAG: hypothetical protein A2499_04755 [Stygiobacter sp. RIFOXYC12_FULL_38_8]|nr:MAG: hypothetical protein A2X62_01120 [Stygiobacter sp. GWC2_38_9]OGU80348.1 MAG: hypothetical protein A2279_08080 [Stygiobacter sp. RIFOXYA12_FULL_38_9]OGV08472.1 MAG: hypothetical protein A2299_03430 [Stygiobacter sp. RIFOXYB2_FULL_37_11]OGV13439.1 MAG: hypothetical protein A2237_16820 [Stygiobacter sp. RIFOXYA2_FULL_38_8]OGV14729.1 MAG: hypothetical protein A2440_09505 [Stygiobacter sp. RIFOXYC2_FULL_38_25]OGV22265.1 MAG: hypothetical protein A2499_04755 [Stygiobacter sp. RIFOXYC12_FULL_